ncbi:type IV pilus assembly protein PilM [Sporomusa malonica]|uniref:Type IV pilus assembly protein PilM n=1 Tax=Sporomusa malonica TaxID=112901 RepID=A0A1W2E9R3_9FIRM|nr:type IV pilus assembly protein PilM [Sporomusa malonica]SMD06520.1 type IV pilus assembly protein PilM [Sporomusa malonica]
MNAKFSKLVGTLQQWLTHGPASTIGIDIGSGVLKIAEISWHKNIPTLRAAGMASLPDDLVRDGIIMDKMALAETLRRLLATAGSTGKHAIISVSGHAVFIRELTFPMMTNEELRQAIKWDLDKYVPANAENYYFDFSVIGAGQEAHEVRVLLVAAPQTVIDAIIAICKEVGLKAVAIDIEPLAVCRTFTHEVNTLVVDIGQKICQISIFQNNCPVVSRLLPLGGARYTDVVMRSLELDYSEAELLKERQQGLLQAITNDGEVSYIHKQLMIIVEELGREIRRTADYYQAQNREAIIESVILTGGGARLDNLVVNLAALLNGVEVKLVDPLVNLEISGSLDPEWLNSVAPQLTVAIGLALRGGESD